MSSGADLSAVVARCREVLGPIESLTSDVTIGRQTLRLLVAAASECERLREDLAERKREFDNEIGNSHVAYLAVNKSYRLVERERDEARAELEMAQRHVEMQERMVAGCLELDGQIAALRAELAEVREDRDSLSRALCDLNDACVALEREHEAVKAEMERICVVALVGNNTVGSMRSALKQISEMAAQFRAGME